MCRLCYVPSFIDGVDYVKLFDYLEKSMGGQGNGIGGFTNGQPFIQKGVLESNLSLYQTAKEMHFDNGFLYHTRLASFGSVCDYNTHPFEYNKTITCHNGTWSEKEVDYVKDFLIKNNSMDADILKPMNDSRLMAMLIGTWGFKQAKTWKPGVVLTLTPKGCMAYVGGSLEYARFGNCYLYASSIPQFIEDSADDVKSFAYGSVVELRPSSFKVLEGGNPTKPSKSFTWNWSKSGNLVWTFEDGKWTRKEEEVEETPQIQSTLVPIEAYEEQRRNHINKFKRARDFGNWREWYGMDGKDDDDYDTT